MNFQPTRMRGTGAVYRPFDPRELAYRLQTPPPSALNLNQAYSLAAYMPPAFNQGPLGSCTAHAVIECAMACARILDINPPMLSRLWDYDRAREVRGWFPQDSGAVLADAFDVALNGIPREELFPYQDNAGLDAPATVDADCHNQDYLLAHQPAYMTDAGGFQAAIVHALSNQQPLAIAMAWWDAFDTPDEMGILPAGMTGNAPYAHAVCIHGYVPPSGGRPWYARARQSWGDIFTPPGVKTLLSDSTQADFYIPGTYFESGVVHEVRAAVGQPQAKPAALTSNLARLIDGYLAPDLAYLGTHPEQAGTLTAQMLNTLDAWRPYLEKLESAGA